MEIDTNKIFNDIWAQYTEEIDDVGRKTHECVNTNGSFNQPYYAKCRDQRDSLWMKVGHRVFAHCYEQADLMEDAVAKRSLYEKCKEEEKYFFSCFA